MSLIKKHWAGVTIGALVIVGGSYVGAHALSAGPQSIALTQAKPESSAAPKAARPGRGMGGLGMRRLVHGDIVVQGKQDGQLRNVRLDHGVLQSVNETTLSIKEADGSTVGVPTTEQTKIVRDGKPAKITDLKAGDNVWTMRVKDDGGALTTMRVRAISPERMKELESKRAERKAART
jgi:hypothetical protein